MKHRKNKNGGQRIIIFIGSPIDEDLSQLLKVGKQLKKNNIAVDVINIGEIDENSEKLAEFIKVANGSDDNCHLITIPAGVSPLDALAASPVMRGGDAGFGQVPEGGGGGFEDYGGIDPSMDPELAMAIRVSTEEARAKEAKDSQAPGSATPNAALLDEGEEDEEALMERALQMSMMDTSPPPQAPATSSGAQV